MALSIRTVGIVDAKAKIGLANLTYNIRRLVLHERRAGLA
jgi:transposase, IS5 family